MAQVRWPVPIRSSRDLTILALSPGKGFNSSLGSKLAGMRFCADSRPLFSRSNLRSRSSSKIVRSSDVIVMAVGFRRIIVKVLLTTVMSVLCESIGRDSEVIFEVSSTMPVVEPT